MFAEVPATSEVLLTKNWEQVLSQVEKWVVSQKALEGPYNQGCTGGFVKIFDKYYQKIWAEELPANDVPDDSLSFTNIYLNNQFRETCSDVRRSLGKTVVGIPIESLLVLGNLNIIACDFFFLI